MGETLVMSHPELQHFLYPLNPKSDFFLEADGQEFETSFEDFPHYLEAAAGRPSKWGLHANHHQIEPRDMVWAYFTAPTSGIGAVGYALDQPYWHAEWDRWRVDIAWDENLTRHLMDSPIPYSAFKQRVLGFSPFTCSTWSPTQARWAIYGPFAAASGVPH